MLIHRILILIFGFVLLYPLQPLAAKTITKQKYDVKNLHLYRTLKPVDQNLKKTLIALKTNDGSLEDLETLLKASTMCSQVLTSMERLVFLFNTKAYEAISQFKWQFLSVCQTLKKHGPDIKPRHVRELAPRLKKFHLAIFNYYYTHKEFMDGQEIELFNEMNRFCSGLRFCLLPGADEYFDFSFIDMFTDTLVFRPIEWMADHKLLVAAGVGVVVIGAWYWHKYKKEQAFAEELKKKARLVGFEMHREPAVQQSGAQCGAYAVVNGILLNATNPDQVLHRAQSLNMPAIFAQVREEIARTGDAARLGRFPQSPEWLAVDQVIELTQEPLFMQGLADALGAQMPGHGRFVVMQGLPSQTLVPCQDYQHLYDSVHALARNNQPQTVITYQGEATTNYNASRGHWVVMHLEPSTTPVGPLQVKVCDSLYAQNVYANPYVAGIAEMYAQRDLESPPVYAGSFEVKTAHQRFQDAALTDEQKGRLAFQDYTGGLAKIYQNDPARFTNPDDSVHKLCTAQFIDCRTRALAIQQQIVEVPAQVLRGYESGGDNLFIDLNEISDFTGYLAWFAGNQPAV
jgi:hypothetical protein